MQAQGIRAAGGTVVAVGLAGQYDDDLPSYCDRFQAAGIVRLGKWIRILRRHGCSRAVMVGKVRKAKIYQPLRLFRQIPDLRAARLWFGVLRRDKRSGKLLAAVADELASAGIHLIDSTTYIPQHLATPGVMGKCQPTAAQQRDVAFGWPLLQCIADIDVGQAIAVKDADVLAVEAIEGTDAMIERSGKLCPSGGWTLLKGPARDHDMRLDVPTVGPDTIENLRRAGGKCLAVRAGKVILVEKERLIELADRYRIAVVGVEGEGE